jgi:hypothetical protein
MTKMTTRVQWLEEVVHQQEEARFERWGRSLTDAELAHYVMDETEAKLESLSTLCNEQLIRLYNGEPLSTVLNQ